MTVNKALVSGKLFRWSMLCKSTSFTCRFVWLKVFAFVAPIQVTLLRVRVWRVIFTIDSRLGVGPFCLMLMRDYFTIIATGCIRTVFLVLSLLEQIGQQSMLYPSYRNIE